MIVQEIYKKIREYYRHNNGLEPRWVIISDDVYKELKRQFDKNSLVMNSKMDFDLCCGLRIAVLPDKEKQNFIELA